MNNASNGTNFSLAVMGGLVTDIDPSDLPGGLSPNCPNMSFRPGMTSTRPGLKRVLSTPLNADAVYLKTYRQPNSLPLTLIADVEGNFYSQNPATGVMTQPSAGPAPWFAANTYVNSATADGREYITSFNLTDQGGISAPCSFDGTNAYRATYDGPGNPCVINETSETIAIAQISQPIATGSSSASPISMGPVSINFYVPVSGSRVYNGVGAPINTTPYTGTSLVWNQLKANQPVIGAPAQGNNYPVGTVNYDAGGNYLGTTRYAETQANKNGFDVNMSFTVEIATGQTGLYSFSILADDCWALFVGNGALYEYGPRNGTPASRYGLPLLAARCANGANDNQNTDTVQISFPHSGSYHFEIGYNNWAGGGPDTFFALTFAQGNPGAATGQNLIGSVIPPLQAAGEITVSESGGIATVLSPTAMVFGPGDYIDIENMSIDDYNGIWPVLSSPSPYSLTFSVASSGLAVGTGGTITALTCTCITDDLHGLLVGDSLVITGNSVPQYNNGYLDTTVSPQTVTPANWVVSAIPDGRTLQFIAANGVGLLGTGGTITGGGLISPGPHKCVVCFEMADGSVTAPGPVSQWTATGGKRATVQGIPIGPPPCVARILNFTASGGGNYFNLPTDVQGQSESLGGITGPTVIGYSTRIPNNMDTSLVLDFADASLLDGTGIDIPGNNLFNQKTLCPSTGVVSYADRLFYWGTWNSIPNLVNMTFDGGTSNGPPEGWSTDQPGTGLLVPGNFGGFAWQLGPGDGTNTQTSTIYQNAYQDANGVAIAQQGTLYDIRCFLRPAGNYNGSGFFTAGFNSPSNNVFVAIAFIDCTRIPVTGAWKQLTFSAALPPYGVTDLRFGIWCTALAAGQSIICDELMIFPTAQPVIGAQILGSYVGNPSGIDSVTGVIQVPSDGEPITNCWVHRNQLYIQTKSFLFSTEDNETTEPSGWAVTPISEKVGIISQRGWANGEERAFLANRGGIYSYMGSTPSKMSQEISTGVWDAINWAAAGSIWTVNDSVHRRFFAGIPIGTATSPSHILVMDYRSCREDEEPADPIKSSQSASGGIYTNDLVRKWSLWPIASHAAALIEASNTNDSLLTIAADGFRNVYTLDPNKFSDDDFGTIGSAYTTYFWVTDSESQQLQLASHRNLYSYLSLSCSGVGLLSVQPFVDSLQNPGRPTRQITLTNTAKFYDIEFPLNILGERVAFEMKVAPLPGQTDAAFSLRKMTMTLKTDPWSPIAGRI